FPNNFPSPLCRLCLTQPETMSHFLYDCPLKWQVWSTLWSDFLLLSPTSSAVQQALYSFSFPPSPPILPSSTIVATILLGIWKAHWHFIFDNTPFSTDTIRQFV
ncbi:uncharacterized protein BYT42DRAFT_483123, partial [Radiomyces spectabilis]|uniref:uncharacterized protein n=1 Tax=Radiomyces spectabilis TaxID=64574 RepID=UPI00221E6C50